MDHKKIFFDSQQNTVASNSYLDYGKAEEGYIRFGIACGYDSVTQVEFVHEKIMAVIHAAGKIAFYDSQEQLLAETAVAPVTDGRGCYQDVCCKVEAGKILVRFPIYSWVDHYPNCDSESDRWSARITGYQMPVALCLS